MISQELNTQIRKGEERWGKERRSKVTMSQLMLPADANPMGNIHGGTIMKLIDNAGAVAAMRYSLGNVVTACIDELNFDEPVHIGNLVILDASVIYVHESRVAMEVEVKAKAENLKTGGCVDVVSANLVCNSLVPILPVSYRHVNSNYYTGPLERLAYLQ